MVSYSIPVILVICPGVKRVSSDLDVLVFSGLISPLSAWICLPILKAISQSVVL